MNINSSKELYSGERQIGITLGDIEPGHVARYEWALKHIKLSGAALDIGCGVGYGAGGILLRNASTVLGVDNSSGAIAFAKDHWSSTNVKFIECSYNELLKGNKYKGYFDSIVCFEVIEHLVDVSEIFSAFNFLLKCNGVVLFSTPNKDVWSVEGHPFHVQHYNLSDIKELSFENNLSITTIAGQDQINVTEEPGKFLLLAAQKIGAVAERGLSVDLMKKTIQNYESLFNRPEIIWGHTAYQKQQLVEHKVLLTNALQNMKEQRDDYIKRFKSLEYFKDSELLLRSDLIYHSKFNVGSDAEKHKKSHFILRESLDRLNESELELALLKSSSYVKLAIKFRSVIHALFPSKKEQYNRHVYAQRKKITNNVN